MECRIEHEQGGSSVKSWIRGSLLGAGAFGKVNLALNVENGELFAVKSAECSVRADADYLAIQNEKQILQSLNSPSVISCFGSDWSVENGKSICNIFLEYMPGGSLADLMKKFGGRLNEQLIRAYTKGILQGLQYIHSQGVVHCDIKGKNILVGSSGVKLADFGSAKRVGEDGSSGDCLAVMKGTPLWMAPEVVRQEEQGTGSDIWSLGCTVVEMATGRAPWSSLSNLANHFVALYHIGCTDEVPDVPASLSAQGKDFLQKCFCRDPRQRWTGAQLLQHPFITEVLPLEAPKTPVSPNSVLESNQDRDWDSQTLSIDNFVPVLSLKKRPLFGIQVNKSNEADFRMFTPENRCEPDSESDPWGSSPFSPPAGKWIVVHSPKSCLPDSQFVDGFSNFVTQPLMDISRPQESVEVSDASNRDGRLSLLPEEIHATKSVDVEILLDLPFMGDVSELKGAEDSSTHKGYQSSSLDISVFHARTTCKKGKHIVRIKRRSPLQGKLLSLGCFCMIHFHIAGKREMYTSIHCHSWRNLPHYSGRRCKFKKPFYVSNTEILSINCTKRSLLLKLQYIERIYAWKICCLMNIVSAFHHWNNLYARNNLYAPCDMLLVITCILCHVGLL
ncbi:hypothetical protein O6H91_22G047700 [Diphasiastrum complanatum]|uniref:Uncharacterized protein n=1 Tax=Diphasiastrum complanatum TaxID=34168 RepID=A0ACC2AF63_DIPCM|nr:hypothetical protein O6H91_22G047700 [Diphasiastrum complanatum]